MSLHAIGLGNMTVKSALDQPFSAEIELIDVGSTPLPGVKVGLAAPENFEEIGLERTAILSLLSFKIIRNAQGKFIILVQSQERMTEPYMEVVVDLIWPKGQLYKAYTVLLDPPGYQLVSTTAQSSPAHYKKVNKHTYEPGVVNKSIITTVEHNPVELNDNKKKATYGPTVTNENVWQIAQRYKTSEVILPQVVLAIVGANPEAFKDGNLNGLNVGVRLVIPATEEILQIPSDLATGEVMAHDKAWNEKTTIIHVLTPPYMNGQLANTTTPIQHFKIPMIPRQVVQSGDAQAASAQVIPIETALPIIHSNQLQTIQNNTQPQASEQYSTTKAELSITTAAVESVRESNALLMEQLRLLQEQNKKLQQQIEQREKQLEKMRNEMNVLMKERLAVASQASSINSSGSLLGYWPLFLLLIAAVGGGGCAYWYLRSRQQEKNKTSPYLTDITREPQSFVPLVDPAPLKTDETSGSSKLAPDSTLTERKDKEPITDTDVSIHEPVEQKMDVSDEEINNEQDVFASKTESKSEQEQLTDKPSEPPVVDMPLTFEKEQLQPAAEPIQSSLMDVSDVTIKPINEVADPESVPFESVQEEAQVDFGENKYQPSFNEPISEEDSSNHDLLEFESGLHELIAEKTNAQKNNALMDDEIDRGLDFVLSLDEYVTDSDNKVAASDDAVEAISLENSEDNQERKSDISDVECRDPELEQSITEFFVEPAEENNEENTIFNEAQVSSETVMQNDASDPLKSTKALNTLLDLAKTYIGMEDFASARHSLDEVLEFGSEAQKEEAIRLLAQINDVI